VNKVTPRTGKRLRAVGGVGLVLALAVCGCTKTPPPVTEVSGVVLLDGKPLPLAKVSFVPDLAGFGAEMISTAVTDDKGRFTLTCGNQQSGAVVGKHRVIVTEGPPPAELRRPDGDTQEKMAAHLAKLTNRPIPQEFGDLNKSPVTVEVKLEQKTYEIRLDRSAVTRKK
jgi:hypothetical protein